MDPLIGMSINFTPSAASKDEDAPRGGLGSQVLPVADLGKDFCGDPEDGMEYLFLVRREAELQPKVNRVRNPYATVDIINQEVMIEEPMARPTELWREAFVQRFTILRERMTLGPSDKSYPTSDKDNSVPFSARDEGAWNVFIHGKKLPQSKLKKSDQRKSSIVFETADVIVEDSEENLGVTMSLEDAKAAALASLELDAPPSTISTSIPIALLPPPPPSIQVLDQQHLPHTPTPSILREIDKPSIIHILSHFTNWLVERSERHEAIIQFVPSTVFAPMAVRRKTTGSNTLKSSASLPSVVKSSPRTPLPTSLEADWILSLLLRLDGLLNGDDIASLRDLARILSMLAEDSGKQSEKRDLRGRSQEQKDSDELEAEARAKSWMIIAVIAGCWGQQDMWQRNL